MVSDLEVLAESLDADVRDLCARLTMALGWRVEYSPASTSDTSPSSGRLWLDHSTTLPTRTELPVALATTQAVSVLLSRLQSALSDLEVRSKEVSTLMELGHASPTRSGLQANLQRLLDGGVELTGLWGAAFFLIDPVMESLRLRAVSRIEPAIIPQPHRSLDRPTPDAQALLRGAILIDRQETRSAEWLPADCRTAIGVPVRSTEGPLGTLWFYERRRHHIDQRCLAAMKSVAGQIALTLERTVLLKESAVRKRLRKELRAASRHQNSSTRLSTVPSSGLDIAIRAASASELSGDLCEICPLDSSRTLLALGDAVGHSIPAAMVMAVARGALRALLYDDKTGDWEPSELVRRINRTLCSSSGSEQFMSVVTGVIDQRTRTLTYCNAGHPPPWMLRRGERTQLKSHGMLCGVLSEAVYTQSQVTLEPGDLLVLFTDGVSEALSPHRQLFHTDGVLDALGRRAWQNADQAADAIWQRMTEHVAHTEPTDDQTLLVIHVREHAAG